MTDDKAKRAAYMREYSRRRREAGLCAQCNKPGKNGGWLCEEHAAKHAAGRNRKRLSWIAAGRCSHCGGELDANGTYCQKCLDRSTELRHRPDSSYNLKGSRPFVLERDGHACRLCGDTRRLHLHHIDNRGLYHPEPNHDPENLITLCHPCHMAITRLVNRKRELAIELLQRAG